MQNSTTDKDEKPMAAQEVDTGGPFMPTIIVPQPGHFTSGRGSEFTLLDYFAGQAILGLIAAELNADVIATTAYGIAQAMIAEKRRLEAS